MKTAYRIGVLALPLLLVAGCGWPPNELMRVVPPFLEQVTFALGQPEFVETGPRNISCAQVICGKGDQMWVLFVEDKHRLMCTTRSGGSWSPFSAVSPPNWKFIFHTSALTDASSNPVVFWCGFDGEGGEALAVARWEGQEWSQPQILDRDRIGSLDSILDSRGNIHLVYDRPLDWPESYTVHPIPILADGVYPDKCHHIVYDGKRWSKPQATMWRGRFDVNDPILSNGPEGRLYLSVVVDPFFWGWENSYIGYQVWGGKGWSAIQRITSPEIDVSTGSVIADKWGVKHICWGELDYYHHNYVTIRKGRASSSKTFSTRPRFGFHPVFKSGPGGRILMFWGDSGGRIRAWNGREWTQAFAFPFGGSFPDEKVFIGGLTTSPDGKVFLVGHQPNGIVIQELFLQEGPSASRLGQE